MSVALERMLALTAEWKEKGDRRCIFAEAYGTMTANMLDSLTGLDYQDAAWVNRLLHRFADYYFDAVDAYESGGRCPEVWHMALEASVRDDYHPLQHLFLGINAHINYDLAFAIADVTEDWTDLEEELRSVRRADHDSVNLIIARTVDEVQSTIIAPLSPALGLVDRLLGRADEWAFSSLVAGWRDAVWVDAVELMEAVDADRGKVVERIETRARETADLVLAF